MEIGKTGFSRLFASTDNAEKQTHVQRWMEVCMLTRKKRRGSAKKGKIKRR